MIRLLKTGAMVAGALLLFVLGIGIQAARTDYGQHKALIAYKVSQATGRVFQIHGDVRLALSMAPALVVEEATLSNASWGVSDEMVKLKRLELEVGFWPLLRGEVQVRRLALEKLELFLENDAHRQRNWELDLGASSSGLVSAAIDEVRIEDASFVYIDGAGRTSSVHIDDMVLLADEPGGPVDVHSSGRYLGHPLTLDGRLDNFDALVAGEPLTLDLTLNIVESTLTASGKLGTSRPLPDFDLDVTLSAGSLTGIMELVGVGIAPRGEVELSAVLSRSGELYSLQGLNARVGASDLNGQVDLDLSAPLPRASASLASTGIDLDGLFPPGSGAPREARDDGRVFADDPIELEFLRTMEADLGWTAERFVSHGIEVNDLMLEGTLADGQLRVKPKAIVAGGSLEGEVSVDARQLPAAMSMLANASDVDLGTIINAQRDERLLDGGSTAFAIEVDSKGDSVRSLMAALNGRVEMAVGPGRIYSATLRRVTGDVFMQSLLALNPKGATTDSTQLECAVVHFQIYDGIAVSKDAIAVQTEQLSLVSGGTVNLQTEELDLGGDIETQEGIGASASIAADFVRLKGTLANPEIGADAMHIASTTATLGGALLIGSAVTTGGLSLLAGAALMSLGGDDSPCLTVSRRATKLSTDTGATTESGDESTGGSKLKGLGSKIKSVFGQ